MLAAQTADVDAGLGRDSLFDQSAFSSALALSFASAGGSEIEVNPGAKPTGAAAAGAAAGNRSFTIAEGDVLRPSQQVQGQARAMDHGDGQQLSQPV